MKVAITGGTGALGTQLVSDWLADGVDSIRVLSRDEHKQARMRDRFGADRVRYFLADVRDRDRLADILWGCDVVIHAAALKRVDDSPYNIGEHRKTNIEGTVNVISAAIAAGVDRVITVSSDKAVSPSNAYGASKMWAELETVQANSRSIPRGGPRLACIRYGNVFGSTGSVAEVWRAAVEQGKPIMVTDHRVTRFHLTLPEASAFVRQALRRMIGGEIFIPKLPAWRIIDLAEAFLDAGAEIAPPSGRRPGGEKLSEALLNEEEATRTLDDGWAYVVTPHGKTWNTERYPGEPVPETFRYDSNNPVRFLSVQELRALAFPERVEVAP